MEWSLFLPLLLGAIAYGLISVIAGVMSGRGNEPAAERLRDYGFLLLLAMGAWTVVLTLISIFSEPDEIWDMLAITLVIVVFFALLLLVFFGISLVVGALRRATSRRRRVTTDEV
jgi:ABC-type dipeptide/oligopeptide/nickel transport system permease component